MEIRWDVSKNDKLREERGVSFERMLQEGTRLFVMMHPVRSHQRLMVYLFQGYIWIIPCVMSEKGMFLKTMFPSRSFTKKWKRGEFHEKRSINQGRKED